MRQWFTAQEEAETQAQGRAVVTREMQREGQSGANIDELAHKENREPLSYRMAMLGHDPRLAECLLRVAALSGWGGGVDASGQGLACHVIGEGDGAGRSAVVATARRADSGVRGASMSSSTRARRRRRSPSKA